MFITLNCGHSAFDQLAIRGWWAIDEHLGRSDPAGVIRSCGAEPAHVLGDRRLSIGEWKRGRAVQSAGLGRKGLGLGRRGKKVARQGALLAY